MGDVVEPRPRVSFQQNALNGSSNPRIFRGSILAFRRIDIRNPSDKGRGSNVLDSRRCALRMLRRCGRNPAAVQRSERCWSLEHCETDTAPETGIGRNSARDQGQDPAAWRSGVRDAACIIARLSAYI